MYKLLNASFFRLKKDKVFWSMIAITLGIACFNLYNSMKNNSGGDSGIDKLLLNYLLLIGIFMSIFTTLFIGLEYASGTIRNKIIVGNSRIKIYITNLIVSIIAGIFMQIVYMLFVTIIGTHSIGELKMPLSQFGLILLDVVMMIVTYASIFTFISLLCTDITKSTVISIVFVLVMFIVESAISPTAIAEKFVINDIVLDNGEIVREKVPDPNYPGDTKKKIAQTIIYIIPTGQASEILNYENLDTNRLLLSSISESIIITIMGLYCFCKEDLK